MTKIEQASQWPPAPAPVVPNAHRQGLPGGIIAEVVSPKLDSLA